jgi:hypothetical protein
MEYRNHVQGDYVRSCWAEAAGRAAIARQARENWLRLGLSAGIVEMARIDETKAAVAEAKALLRSLSIASLDGVIGRMVPATRHRIIEVLKRAGLE